MFTPEQHLVILRSSASILNTSSYNCQEIGLAKALTTEGLKVSVILAGIENKVSRIQVGEGDIFVYYMRFISLNQSLGWFKGIGKLLQELNPTCIQIHEFGMLMSFIVLQWAKKNNVKVVLVQGSYKVTQKPVFKQLEILFNYCFGRFILKNVSAIGCKTYEASDYVKHYVNRPTLLTPIGLDIDKFQKYQSINWKKDLSLYNKKVLLYVGVLEPRRNPLFLVEILKELPEDYVLLIVGSGSQKNILQDYIINNNLQDKVKLLGLLKQEELPSLYRSADLFLLASDYEIYGMVILESMYFGLPVISTPTAGAEVLIDNGEDGIIMNKDVVGWSREIQAILTSDRILSMKKKASDKILNSFVWSKACLKFIQLYDLN